MKKLIITLLIIIWIIPVGAYLQYGTLEPCGVLRKELKSKIISQALKTESKNEWEVIGQGIGMALVDRMIDNKVDSLTLLQCTEHLFNLYKENMEYSET
jgi:hypothetical protein